jgi:hypothetical protein
MELYIAFCDNKIYLSKETLWKRKTGREIAQGKQFHCYRHSLMKISKTQKVITAKVRGEVARI